VSSAAEHAGRHVTLHVWRVPGRRLPPVLWRMARDPGRLRALPGVTFGKLLGTGRDRRFGPTQADLGRWAAVLSWDDEQSAAGFEDSAVARDWRSLSTGYCRIDLSPRTSRGTWAGQAPFDFTGPKTDDPATHSPETDGPETDGPQTAGAQIGGAGIGGAVLVLTRARLRPTRAAEFWRAIAPVAATAATAPGLLATFGIGEAPVGWQGTVSVWRSARDLVEFAYHRSEHRRVIAATPVRRWYAEELFARFSVLSVAGDRGILGWVDGGATRTDDSGQTGDPTGNEDSTRDSRPATAAQTKEAP